MKQLVPFRPRYGDAAHRDPGEWLSMSEDPDFCALVARKRRFLLTSWLLVASGYFALLVGAAMSPAWFAMPLWGEFNIGLLLALGESVLVLIVAALYVRRARCDFDSSAEALAKRFRRSIDV